MNPFVATTLALMLSLTTTLSYAGDAGRLGTVDFAFDGGTITCEFGTKDRSSKPSVAFIVHPASVKARATAGHKNLILKPGTTGSTVLIIDADGKHRQLDRKAIAEWARQRVSEMATRRSSVEENAFVAAAMYTVTTGHPLHVWADDGVNLLRSGHWVGLFNPAPRAPDGFPDRDPFADPNSK